MAFERIRAYFRWIGLFHWDPTPKGRIITLILNCIYVVFFIIAEVSIVYDLLYTSDTLGATFDCIFFIVTTHVFFGFYIFFAYQRDEYETTFNTLDTLIEKSEQFFVNITVFFGRTDFFI